MGDRDGKKEQDGRRGREEGNSRVCSVSSRRLLCLLRSAESQPPLQRRLRGVLPLAAAVGLSAAARCSATDGERRSRRLCDIITG